MQRRAGILDRTPSHIIEGDRSFLHVGPERRPFRREQSGAEAGRFQHRDHRLGELLIQRIAAHRRLQFDVDAVGIAGLGQEFLRSLGIVIQFGLEVGVVAVLAGTDRAVQAAGEAFEQGLDDLIAIDCVADGLANFFFVEGGLRLHGEEHDLHRVHRRNFQIGIFFNAVAQMRRYELGDLNFVVEQSRHPLLGLAHDAVNDLVGRSGVFLGIDMIRPLLQYQPLARDKLL